MFLKSLSIPVLLALVIAYYHASTIFSEDRTNYGSPPPWPVFKTALTVSMLLRQLADWLTPPVVQVFEMSFGVNKAASLHACSKLGWPEVLAGGPKTCEDLSKAGNMSIPMARRLLRACVAAGVFHELTAGRADIKDANRKYLNTPVGDVLRENHPYSVKHFVGHHFDDIVPALLHILEGAKDSDKIPFATAHKVPHTRDALWRYMASHPELDHQFNKAMTSTDGISTAALVRDYNWAKNCDTVVDIGGGRGTFLAALQLSLTHNRSIKGILFDQPAVIKQSQELWEQRYKSLQNRVSMQGGDFFQSDEIPRRSPDATNGRFCYTARIVLHDWNDEDAVKILRNIASVMHPGDRFLVLEAVQMEPETLWIRAMLDVQMLAIGGKERTVADFRKLFAAAGLEFTAAYVTRSIFTIVEAVKRK
jgi:hypothetical protein